MESFFVFFTELLAISTGQLEILRPGVWSVTICVPVVRQHHRQHDRSSSSRVRNFERTQSSRCTCLIALAVSGIGTGTGTNGLYSLCRTFLTAPEQGPTPFVPHCSGSDYSPYPSTTHSQCDNTIQFIATFLLTFLVFINYQFIVHLQNNTKHSWVLAMSTLAFKASLDPLIVCSRPSKHHLSQT